MRRIRKWHLHSGTLDSCTSAWLCKQQFPPASGWQTGWFVCKTWMIWRSCSVMHLPKPR